MPIHTDTSTLMQLVPPLILIHTCILSYHPSTHCGIAFPPP